MSRCPCRRGPAARWWWRRRAPFRRLVADLRAQLDGAAGACVLSHEGRVLDMARCLELFVDFVPFPCNRRTLLARALGARWERQAAVEPAQLHAALLPLTAYLLELCGEYGLTLEPEKLTVSGLLKLAGACIGEPPAAPGAPGPPDTLCAILGYLDLVAQLEREKLFVFVNARSYFAQEETGRVRDRRAGAQAPPAAARRAALPPAAGGAARAAGRGPVRAARAGRRGAGAARPAAGPAVRPGRVAFPAGRAIIEMYGASLRMHAGWLGRFLGF